MAMEMKDKKTINKHLTSHKSSELRLLIEVLVDIRDTLVELVELKRNKRKNNTGPR